MALFYMPWPYIPSPIEDKPLFGGKMYFGIAGQNPKNFPKDVNIIQEGQSATAEQPIIIGVGGLPEYDGSSVSIELLEGDYSLTIEYKNGGQAYNYPSLSEAASDLTANALRAASLRLNLDATEIGTTLITNEAEQPLDDARYLLDTLTGLLYSLPDDIPTGSTVVSSSGTTLVTSNGQFEMNPVWHYAVNRLIGNQIPVVEGTTGDLLPSAVETDYLVGAELAAGWEVIEVDATAVTFVDGVLNSADNVGIIRRKYKQDDAGFITKESEFGSVTLADGTQIYAQIDDISNGCRITEDSGYVCVDIDLSNAALVDGFRYHGLSAEVGEIAEVNEDESTTNYFSTLGAVLIVASNYSTVGDEPDAVVTDANLPDLVSSGSRYILTNPFGINTKVDVQAQVLELGKWADSGWFYSTGGYGTSGTCVAGEGVIIQTGSINTYGSSQDGGGGHGYTGGGSPTAPCRVWVTPVKSNGGAQ